MPNVAKPGLTCIKLCASMHDTHRYPAPEASRRRALGSMLALGYALLPFALFGCDTRQATPEAKPPSPDEPAAVKRNDDSALSLQTKIEDAKPDVPVEHKIAKYKVAYQDEPKKGRMCAKCVNFIAETEACKIVEGSVSPLGWCKLWAVQPT